MLNSVRFATEKEFLFMWTVSRLFMFGPIKALLALLCRAQMMGLIKSTKVNGEAASSGVIHSIMLWASAC